MIPRTPAERLLEEKYNLLRADYNKLVLENKKLQGDYDSLDKELQWAFMMIEKLQHEKRNTLDSDEG